jgi:hypothetical protein
MDGALFVRIVVTYAGIRLPGCNVPVFTETFVRFPAYDASTVPGSRGDGISVHISRILPGLVSALLRALIS